MIFNHLVLNKFLLHSKFYDIKFNMNYHSTIPKLYSVSQNPLDCIKIHQKINRKIINTIKKITYERLIHSK